MLELQVFAQLGTPPPAGLPDWLKILLAAIGAGLITGFITILVNIWQMKHQREALRQTLNTEYGKLHAVKKLEAYQAFCKSLVILPDASQHARDPRAPFARDKVEQIYTEFYGAYPFLEEGTRNAFDKHITNLLVRPELTYSDLLQPTAEVLKAATDDLDTMRE